MNRLHQQELIEIINQHACSDGMFATANASLGFAKASSNSLRMPVVYEPSLCIIVQGKKEIMLENEIYHYEPAQYLVASVDLPVTGQVIQASKKKPYFSLQLKLDVKQISELVSQLGSRIKRTDITHRGLFIGTLNSDLLDSIIRLARLLKTPADIPFLAPIIEREIYYRLLSGEHGPLISQIFTRGTNMHRISQAIEFLKHNFDKTIAITDMVERVNMSPSSFHVHFKEVTAMTPLQYQKRLRLLEARRIMLAESMDAANTAFRVGYESPSQFSREYTRMFGAPPVRDIERIRLGS